MTIKRIWHGYTTPERADEYEALLKAEVIQGIEAKGIPGFRKIEVLRRPVGDEVEFITVMEFDSFDSVRAFVGDDYEQAYVPAEARAILSRFDERSQHYVVEEIRTYGPAAETEDEMVLSEEAVAGLDGDAVEEPQTVDDPPAQIASQSQVEDHAIDERYEAAPIIDAVPVVEPAEESLVSEEPVLAPPPAQEEPIPQQEPARAAAPEAPSVLASDKWFVSKDRGRGAVPATREGYKVVARFIFGMLICAVLAVVMVVAAAYGAPQWLRPAALAVFVIGAALLAIYFIISARRHTDRSITYSEYRRLAHQARATVDNT